MLLAIMLTLVSTSDIVTPKRLSAITKVGKAEHDMRIVQNALHSMVQDAEEGNNCTDLYPHSDAESNLLFNQLKLRMFSVTNLADMHHFHLQVCWD